MHVVGHQGRGAEGPGRWTRRWCGCKDLKKTKTVEPVTIPSLETWFPPTLTFSFQILQTGLILLHCHLHIRSTEHEKIGGNQEYSA